MRLEHTVDGVKDRGVCIVHAPETVLEGVVDKEFATLAKRGPSCFFLGFSRSTNRNSQGPAKRQQQRIMRPLVHSRLF